MSHSEIIEAVSCLIPGMRDRSLDNRASFPLEDIDQLRHCGALAAPLPLRHGGQGWTSNEMFAALRLIGSGNLAVGRIFEGHANALHLICRFGDEAQIDAVAADVRAGHLFAIWNTEAPPGLRSDGAGTLSGRKIHVSAAGIATRAVITVDQDLANRMLVVALEPGERAGPMQASLQGMRTTASGWVDFDGFPADPSSWIGEPGDYLREPDFSAGAWRTLAVLLGGLDCLVDELCAQLRERRRDGAPMQRTRIAQALIARETAALWVQKCALLVDDAGGTTDAVISYVNLARAAVERAGFEIMQLAQQSLGLMALVESNPVELLLRDLTTYLRQPAMDEALDEAAAHFVAHPVPRITEMAA